VRFHLCPLGVGQYKTLHPKRDDVDAPALTGSG